MDLNQQKEQFSYAYIYAIASTAGYSFQIAAKPLDFDGIDIILAGSSVSGAYPLSSARTSSEMYLSKCDW